MDLSKAFDCLPHGLLIAKLNAYGLTEPACELMASYLSGRMQRVKVADARSEWKVLEKGVPQGSILGPLLFNIFLNDMFYFMNLCTLYNFADDNSIANTADSLENLLSNLKNDSKISIDWFKENGMEANPSKFQFLVSSRQSHGKIEIKITDDVHIYSEPSVKVLGVYIDERFNFNEHVQKSCSKAARQLNALARISKYLNVGARKLIFNSFVLSNFSYCPLVWHFCGKINNSKIEKIQERALRIVLQDYTSDYDALLKKFGTITVHKYRINQILIETFKSFKNINPTYIQNLVHRKAKMYDMRSSIILEQPVKDSTTFGLRSYSYLASKLWNDLPLHMKNIEDVELDSFKSIIKHWNGPNSDLISNFHV